MNAIPPNVLRRPFEPFRTAIARPSFRRGYHQPPQPSFFRAPEVVPYLFMGICFGGYGYSWYADQELREGHPGPMGLLRKHATCSLDNFREGRYYTLVSSSFMHFTGIHIACNMLGLYNLGPQMVMAFGPGTFLAIWLGGAVACGSAELYWESSKQQKAYVQAGDTKGGLSSIWKRQSTDAHQPESVSFGASGSVLSLLGAFVGLAPKAGLTMFPIPFALPAWFATTVFASGSVYCLKENLIPGIGHAGHLGGLAFGLAYYLLRLRFRRF